MEDFLNKEMSNSEVDAYTQPATDLLKEAVIGTLAEKNIDVDMTSTMDITGITPAQIVDTLFMKIIDGQLFKPRYRFVLSQLFAKKLVRLGNVEYKYHDLAGTSDTLDIQAANTIEDFNGEHLKEYAEVFKLEYDFHKKVKVPELLLSDAWVAAERMVEFVQIQVEEMTYAIERRWENLAWSKMLESAVEVSLTGAEAIDHLKQLQSQVMEYRTTSDEHIGVGENGVITVSTVQGDQTIQPTQYFETSEWYVLVDKDQYVDTEFDNDAQWFNYAATNLNGLTFNPISFGKYAGLKAIANSTTGEADVAPAIVIPEGTKFILIHKESIELLQKYTYTSTVKGRGPWVINHNSTKIDAYHIKDKPILVFKTEAVVEPAKATK